jgi:hypothetical protein
MANTDCGGGYFVTQLGIVWKPEPQPSSKGFLTLNGQLIEGVSVDRYKNRIGSERLSVSVYDTEASTLLMLCRLAEIAKQIDDLTLQIPEAINEYFDQVKIVLRDYDGIEALRFDFRFDTDVTLWAKSWSITDFVSTLISVVEDRGILGLSCNQPGEYVLDPPLTLSAEPHTPGDTVQQVLQHWLPIIKDVCEEAETILATTTRKEALVALFQFAPEIKTTCEQYLLYFVQFLEDLGISATADLQEQARGVLFTVTPKSGPEALERIREALDIYLQMPLRPDLDAEVTRHTDIAVRQYAANVLHLRSQLTLAQAVLEAKDATIENLQAANLQYKQLLGAKPQSQGQLSGSGAGNAQGDEDILGGAVTITKYTGKGFQVNLPLIFRELRRRLIRER